MTLFLNNKFNAINIFNNDNNFDYHSQTINFIENYLESEISILHPSFLYQLTLNGYDDKLDYKIIIIFKNYLKKLKINIKNAIKKADYCIINSLNKLIENYNFKLNYLETIFKINKENYYNLFHDIILSDQIIICVFETEYPLIINNVNSEIKNLINNVQNINVHNKNNYIWFLKLIGNIINNNKPKIKESIKFKQIYEIKIMINYILEIKRIYNFINEDNIYIIEPIIEIFIEQIRNFLLIENNYEEFYFLFENYWKHITNILNLDNNIKLIKNELMYKILTKIKLIENTDLYNIYKLIKLIINIDNYKICSLHLVLNNEKINLNLINFINEYINIDINIVKKIVLSLSNIKDKDIFIINYHNELIKRLLSTKTSINNEIIINNLLERVFGEKEIIKIKKCVNDYINSSNNLLIFSDNINFIQQFNITLITTSYDSWNINYNNGFIDGNICEEINYKNTLTNFLHLYNKFYQTKIDTKRKLLWLMQYGEIEIEYNNNILKMLPIQLLILELFNENETIDIKKIQTNKLFSNFQSDYINNIIKSLEICGILNNTNNILTLTQNIYNDNLIESYYNCTNNLENNIIIEDIAHNRREIICSWINHILKKGNKNFDELLTLIILNIKQFVVSKILVENAIKYMIKQEYIQVKDNNYIKLFY
jgi:hypothetical protein